MYQASASVYAAIASSRSSVQPLLGLEYEPHSTIARGLAVRDSEAYRLAIIWSYAAFQGWAPACTLPRTKSSWARLTSTPGWVKVAGAAAGAADAGAAAGALSARAGAARAVVRSAARPAASAEDAGDGAGTHVGCLPER